MPTLLRHMTQSTAVITHCVSDVFWSYGHKLVRRDTDTRASACVCWECAQEQSESGSTGLRHPSSLSCMGVHVPSLEGTFKVPYSVSGLLSGWGHSGDPTPIRWRNRRWNRSSGSTVDSSMSDTPPCERPRVGQLQQGEGADGAARIVSDWITTRQTEEGPGCDGYSVCVGAAWSADGALARDEMR